MAEPFLAEIRMLGFNFAPRGWATCDGQLLPINQNQALYSLLGTTYGGDGRTNFALPDLRGRTPIHAGQGSASSHTLGQKSGTETHALSLHETPSHDHALMASGENASSDNPSGKVLAKHGGGSSSGTAESGLSLPESRSETTERGLTPSEGGSNLYGDFGPAVVMGAASTGITGASQAHDNMQPFLSLNFCIALMGLFPSRS